MPDNSVITVNPDSKGGETRINWHYIEQIAIKYFSNDLKILFTEKSEKGTLRSREYLQKGSTHILPMGEEDISMKLLMDFSKKGITLILNL